jgi:hypothetical protein
MAKTTSQRKTRTARPRKEAGEASPKTAASPKKLPKAIQAVIDAAQDRKASGVVVLDLKKAAAFTDYFVICSASNPRQVQAIADAAPRGVELLSRGVDPRTRVEDVAPQLDAERYRRMLEHFDRIGPSGARMMRQTSIPDSSGSIRSSRTRSGRSARNWLRASRPSAAATTRNPSASSASTSASRSVGSSSTTKIVRAICRSG